MKTCKLDIDANIFKRHDAKSNIFGEHKSDIWKPWSETHKPPRGEGCANSFRTAKTHPEHSLKQY